MPPIKKKSDVPQGLISVIYNCAQCGGKHTFGTEFFDDPQNKLSDNCPNCGNPYDHEDQIQRLATDTNEDLLMKRDDLRRKRGEKIPVIEKPIDPEEVKRLQIKALRDQADRMERGEDSKRGIRLGP